MTNEQLLEEIRELRKDVKEEFRMMRQDSSDLKKEFYIFKGKAAFLMATLSMVFSVVANYFRDKIGL